MCSGCGGNDCCFFQWSKPKLVHGVIKAAATCEARIRCNTCWARTVALKSRGFKKEDEERRNLTPRLSHVALRRWPCWRRRHWARPRRSALRVCLSPDAHNARARCLAESKSNISQSSGFASRGVATRVGGSTTAQQPGALLEPRPSRPQCRSWSCACRSARRVYCADDAAQTRL